MPIAGLASASSPSSLGAWDIELVASVRHRRIAVHGSRCTPVISCQRVVAASVQKEETADCTYPPPHRSDRRDSARPGIGRVTAVKGGAAAYRHVPVRAPGGPMLGALAGWRADEHRRCGIDRPSGDQPALLREATDGLGAARCSSAAANPDAGLEGSMGNHMSRVVSGVHVASQPLAARPRRIQRSPMADRGMHQRRQDLIPGVRT